MKLSDSQIIACIKTGSSLYFTNSQIGLKEIQLICAQKCDHICTIVLHLNQLTGIALAPLSQAKQNNLTHLGISYNNIGSLGCKYLSRATMKKLTTLDIIDNHFGTAGLTHLSKADWQEIEKMQLYGNNFANGSMKIFTKGNFKAFRSPEVCKNHKNKAVNRLTLEELQFLLLLPRQIEYLHCEYHNMASEKEIDKLKMWARRKFTNLTFSSQEEQYR